MAGLFQNWPGRGGFSRRLPVLLAIGCCALCAACGIGHAAEAPASADFAAVNSIFEQHCLDCHAANDPEGDLVLENYDALMKGGKSGPALVPGKSGESLLVEMVEGRFEKEGKKKIMPPGKMKKLAASDIALIKAWIDAGAKPPAVALARKELKAPKIEPTVRPQNPIFAFAESFPNGSGDGAPAVLAAARHAVVELRALPGGNLRTLAGHEGNVNAVVFSADGKELFSASGQPGVGGQIKHWRVSDGTLLNSFQGHADAIYALALSPDGKVLASGSYDQKIKLWDVSAGKETRTLSGHNGCIYDLAFRADGKILASASADRTVKLWEVASGQRRDTFSESLKELYTVAFSPDGRRLAAGGGDNRIRVWQISESAAETTNPILYSKFAHEGAVLKIVFSADGKTLLSSADDKTVKVWEAAEMKERLLLPKQPDWPRALAFIPAGRVAVGRMDGTIGIYDPTGTMAGTELQMASGVAGRSGGSTR